MYNEEIVAPLATILVVYYFVVIVLGLVGGRYRRKSDFLLDLLPLYGIARILYAKYKRLT